MDEVLNLSHNEKRFFQLCWEQNPLDRMYVYLLIGGKKVFPAILKNVTPFDDLEMFLQAEYGAQSYCVMISRGKKLILSHIIHIAAPRDHIPRKDILAEIEKLRREKRNRK